MRRFSHALSRCVPPLAALLFAQAAGAAPGRAGDVLVGPGGRAVMLVPPAPAQPLTSPLLYLNRCAGGCTVHYGSIDDARAFVSAIPTGGGPDYPLTEFAWGDDEWAQIVQCMKEVYSPFAVTVTDQRPTGGESFTMAIIAGSARQIGHPEAGGIAPLTTDCSPRDNVISFSFANDYPAAGRVNQVCWTAAQETAHAFGLDHAFMFVGDVRVSGPGGSACNDPMTYREDCGGRKFFRNELAVTGGFSPEDHRCQGTLQNSHLKILSIFGPGTPITAAPALDVLAPATGATITPSTTVNAKASGPRGVAEVSLSINGHRWASLRGAVFGANGQPESIYALKIPAGVPDGVMDLVVTAEDDIGVTTTSPAITVTRGAPCADASSCLAGQKCEAGKCYWDPPSGELGDACTYAEFCKSGRCTPTGAAGSARVCTEDCFVSVSDSCPASFVCASTNPSTDDGQCIPEIPGGDGAGCCSAGTGAPAAHAGLAALVAAALARGRRRRR